MALTPDEADRKLRLWLASAYTVTVFVMFFGIMFRYQVVVATGVGVAYRLDRWTGDVVYIAGKNSGPAEFKKE